MVPCSEIVAFKNLSCLIPAIVWAVTLSIIFVGTTGQLGSTIGKRLCGIRIVRTTLRPCGFARALLREIMLWLDTPLLLTPIPGVFMILITDNRQRIGDLLADTIAIQASNARVRREPDTNEKSLGTLVER